VPIPQSSEASTTSDVAKSSAVASATSSDAATCVEAVRGPSKSADPSKFWQLTVDNIAGYVAADAALAARVGPADSKASWTADEIGDGNINFVFVVKGPTGTLLIKQGLPYVRSVGKSWPLTQVCPHLLHLSTAGRKKYDVRGVGEQRGSADTI
jgi:hypothetical protein